MILNPRGTGSNGEGPDGGSVLLGGLDRRFSELELRLLTAETTATEQKAERLVTERDFCGGLTSFESQAGGTTSALGETLTGLVLETGLLKSKLAALDPWTSSDPWTGNSRPKGPLSSNNGQPGNNGSGGFGGGGGGSGPPGPHGGGHGGPPGGDDKEEADNGDDDIDDSDDVGDADLDTDADYLRPKIVEKIMASAAERAEDRRKADKFFMDREKARSGTQASKKPKVHKLKIQDAALADGVGAQKRIFPLNH